MYDISKLDIGDTFYVADGIFLFTENKVIDKKNNFIYVQRRDLSGEDKNFREKELCGLGEEETCYKTKEEAEQVYNENINEIREELADIKTLLNRLYFRAFESYDVETKEIELFKEAVSNYINKVEE